MARSGLVASDLVVRRGGPFGGLAIAAGAVLAFADRDHVLAFTASDQVGRSVDTCGLVVFAGVSLVTVDDGSGGGVAGFAHIRSICPAL